MKLSDWTLEVGESNCVHVHINEDVPLDGLELAIVNETRAKILRMKVTDREIYVCTPLERPMYVDLGGSMKYISGSGFELYKNDGINSN
jgi:hypothetical protein